MAWRGRQTALKCNTVAEFSRYLHGLNYSSWRPSGMVLHNTASPTLDQWWHGGTTPEQRMKNLRSYYENTMGWSAGPHAFVDGVSILVFTDFNVKGVHSPSWNGTRLGIEMVGDYDKESDETGMGAKVMELSVALFGECMTFFGWEPNNTSIKLHKEDPNTDHDCPGKNVVKSEFISDCNQYIAEGGDHGPPPNLEPRQGKIVNVPPGDKLNIRATSSSSSDIIGKAVNDDMVTVVGEAYNGSTKWLKLKFGQEEGPDIEVFGWVSSKYVEIEGAAPAIWRENITATVFGGKGDEQETAYGGWVGPNTYGLSLPYKWTKGERPQVLVSGPRGEVTTSIIDVGPWNINDPAYVNDGARPMVEKQYQLKLEAQNGQVPTNDAAIDLTEPIAAAVGISGKGKVKWRFAPAQEPQTS